MEEGISMREEIFIAGFGGQGIVVAGELLAKAAMLKGYYAILTKFYGAEVRGGPVGSGIIISEKPILFQFVRTPDFLLALHESGVKAHAPKKARIVIADEDLVREVNIECDKILKFPIVKTADKIESVKVANMVILGIYSVFSNLIDVSALEEAIRKFMREKYVEQNIRAIRKGAEIGRSSSL